MNDRKRGIVLHRLDWDALSKAAVRHLTAAFPEAEWVKARPEWEYVIAETTDGETYVICSEGVGWKVTYSEPFTMYVAPSWREGRKTVGGMTAETPVFLYLNEVRKMISTDTVDLADFVREFGSRLENNFWLWHGTLDGKVKDEREVLRQEIVGHRSTRKLAQKYIDRYDDALGDTTWWNGSRNVPVHIDWRIEPAEKGFDIVSTVYAREEEK